MPPQLNHTIVWCKDQMVSSTFLTEMLGFAPARPFGPFLVVDANNQVSLDFMEVEGAIPAQHYAFLVDEAEFDQIFDRIQGREIEFWADPHGTQPGEINHHDGGRGVYFPDPDGHLLEILTRPYGSG